MAATQAFLALGGNLGERQQHLETALQALHQDAKVRVERVSPAYENPAHVPDGAPFDWRRPFLNLVARISTEHRPQDLLKLTQSLERDAGRVAGPRWAPRPLDIDLISYGAIELDTAPLTLPHARAHTREFVLAPLKDLDSDLVLPGQQRTVLELARQLPAQLPAWMQIVNATPDSFSGDGRQHQDLHTLASAQYIDVGAESTRPQATPVSAEAEWQRLAPLLNQQRPAWVRPRLSVDTRHASTAARALAAGVDVINDVSGVMDAEMLRVLAQHECDVVVMHSLSVPADPQVVLAADVDVVEEVYRWLLERVEHLQRAGIARRRIVLDPGIGFGKTPQQSWALLHGVQRLLQLPCRLLIGHSRKSFLGTLTERPAAERDVETLAVSQRLAAAGVDLLRVHDVSLHQRFQRATEAALPAPGG